jgi:hypothetical protein
LKRLNFRNIENGLVLPVHAVWLKSQPLQKGASASSNCSATDTCGGWDPKTVGAGLPAIAVYQSTLYRLA